MFLEKYLIRKEKANYKRTILENYELILACVNSGYGVALFSRKIIEKFGYSDKLKITDMNFDLNTYLICRKDSVPMIGNYLKKIWYMDQRKQSRVQSLMQKNSTNPKIPPVLIQIESL